MEALSVVIRDIGAEDIDEILCLGDIVGYGPDPEACIDEVMSRARWSLMGNHDYALLHGPEGFNPIAAAVIRATADRMGADAKADAACPHAEQSRSLPCLAIADSSRRRWRYVENLSSSRSEGDILYVHGSPLDSIFEYVFPDRFGGAWRPGRIRDLMAVVPWIAFCGHTHFPCAIASDLTCYYPRDGESRLHLDRDRKYIVNTGSVGQPRDGDPRASYVLFDEAVGAVEWRRLAYDIAAVSAKIEVMCGKNNWCARRLWKGQ